MPRATARTVARWLVRLLLLVLAGGAAQACQPAPCTHNWIGPANGQFGTAANWDAGTVPVAASKVCAPAGSSIVVNASATVTTITSQGAVMVPAGSSLGVAGPAPSQVSVLDLSGGSVSGALTVGSGTWSDGAVGPVTITGPVTIPGAVTAGPLTVPGSLTVLGTGALTGGQLTVPGSLTVLGNGAVTAGPLSLPTGGTVDVHDTTAHLTMSGSSRIEMSGGTLRGQGTVGGDVIGFGTIEPGSSGGRLTVTGQYLPNGAANVHSRLVSPTPSGHGQLRVEKGPLDLGQSTLTITADPSYTMTAGDNYAVLESPGATLANDFGSVAVPTVGGYGFHLRRSVNEIRLWVTNCDPATRHPNAALAGASLANELLRGCALDGANLSGADFTNADLTWATLTGANLSGAIWSNTICPDGANSDSVGGTCVGHLPLELRVNTGLDRVDANPGDGICQTSTPGQCSLRAAIQESNANPSTDHIILGDKQNYALTIAGQGEDAAATGDLDVTDSVDLDGNGSFLNANSVDRTFDVIGTPTVTIRRITLGNPFAWNTKAAIENPAGRVSLSDVYIVLHESGVRSSGYVRVDRSSFMANTSPIVMTGGSVDLDDVTVSTSGGSGSAITATSGAMTIVDSTITNNTAVGVLVGPSATVSALNSLVTNQQNGKPDCSGPLVSLGYNLSSGTTCGFVATGDLQGVDPNLTPPIKVSGLMVGHLPITGSPAIDSGRPSCGGTDQRGKPRSTDGDGDAAAACDRGAIELGPWNPLTLDVTASGDWPDATPGDGICAAVSVGGCTPRAAFMEANLNSGPDVINLHGVQSTSDGSTGYGVDDEPSTGDMDVFSPVTVHGGGANIGFSNDRQIDLYGGTPFAADGLTTSINDRRSAVTLTTSSISITVGAGGSLDAASSSIGLTNAGTATIDRSGIGGLDNAGTVTVTQSTVDSWVRNTAASSQITLTDSTIDGGSNPPAGVIDNRLGGIIRVSNSILASRDISHALACSGPITSLDYNVASDASCALSGAHDVQNVDVRLAPIIIDGPRTVATPLDGSPAIDSGRPGCPASDQLGRPRPTDSNGDGTAACDRGAVESRPWQPLVLDVDATVDKVDASPGDGICQTDVVGQCTLRAAVQESNALPGPDTIRLQAATTYPLTIRGTSYDSVDSASDLDLISGLTIQGNGATVDAYQVSQPGNSFETHKVPLAIDHLTITYGPIQSDENTLTITSSDTAVDAGGTLTVSDSVVTGVSSGQATIDRSTIAGGSGHLGLGGTATIRRSTVEQSTIDVSGAVTVSQSTVHNGSFSATEGSLDLSDSTIMNGSITRGPWGASGTVTMTNTIIAGPYSGTACSNITVASGGYNVVSDASCGLGQPSDLSTTDPQLGIYRLTAGTTKTVLPMDGSPAIDSGPATCTPTDQRGLPQPTDGDGDGLARCDRGATEVRTWTPLSLTVNSTLDKVDANPGDGVCATSTPTECTLRAAIEESSTSTGDDTIALQTGATYQLTINGDYDDLTESGDLDIASGLVITGNGATVDANNLESAFQARAHRPLAISGLTVGGVPSYYYAIEAGPAPLTASHLTTVASWPESAYISGDAGIQLTDSSLTAPANGKTAVMGTRDMVLDRVLFSNADAKHAGAGTMTITRSSFVGNAVMKVEGGSASVRNSTFTGNAAVWATGGSTLVTNTTLVDSGSSMPILTDGSITLVNSIVSNSTTTNACSGPVLSGGTNLVDDTSCALSGPGDVSATDPRLGPVGVHGSGLPTYLPLTGSPAIDTGASCGAADQRDLPRPADGDGNGTATCDRGAVELTTWNPMSLAPNTTIDAVDANPGDGVCQTAVAGQCTVRAAIQEANESTGPDTLTLAPATTYTLSRSGTNEDFAATGDLDVATGLQVNGTGATLDVANLDNGFQGQGTVSWSVDGLTIRRANTAIAAGLGNVTVTNVSVNSSGTFASSSGSLSVDSSTADTTSSGVTTFGGTAVITRTTLKNASTCVFAAGGTTTVRADLLQTCRQAVTGSGGAVVVDNSTITDSGSGTTTAVTATGSMSVSIVSSTITQSNGKALQRVAPASMSVRNSIVANQNGGNPNCGGAPITSSGYNLLSDTSCGFAATGDVQGVNPLLGSLGNNGGPTLTHAPVVGSPAIDTGQPGCTGTDQRGIARPQGAGCDKGAVEQ